MTVGILINTAWNIYNFRKGLVEHLIKQGHKVVAIAPTDQYVSHLKQLGCTFHSLPMISSSVNPLADIQLMIRIGKALKKEKVDMLLTYTIKPNIYGSIASRFLGIPVICNLSGLGTTFVWNNLISKIAVLLYNLSVKHASHVFFQNPDDQKLFLSKVPVREEKVSLLNGSGINLSDFQAIPKKPWTYSHISNDRSAFN